MDPEKFDYKEYRDNLAEDLKDSRNQGEEGKEFAKQILAEEKLTSRYAISKNIHGERLQETYEVVNPVVNEKLEISGEEMDAICRIVDELNAQPFGWDEENGPSVQDYLDTVQYNFNHASLEYFTPVLSPKSVEFIRREKGRLFDFNENTPVNEEYERSQKSKEEFHKIIDGRITPDSINSAITLHSQGTEALAVSIMLGILSEEQKWILAENLAKLRNFKYSPIEKPAPKPDDEFYYKLPLFRREETHKSGNGIPVYLWYVKTPHGEIRFAKEFGGDRSNSAARYGGFDFY